MGLMEWPPSLGDLSLPLYTNEGDGAVVDQTAELDPWGGLLPLYRWETGLAQPQDDAGGDDTFLPNG